MKGLINRITINPDVCNGKPTIRGKRITVQTILEQYPSLEMEDIDACLECASTLLENKYEIKPIYG